MDTYTLAGLLCILLVTPVFSLPALVHSRVSLTPTGQAVSEYSPTLMAIPIAADERQTHAEAEMPEAYDDDDMETAEVLVFRPLFKYKHVQAERRRRLNEARRRQTYVPYYPYYPYRQ